MWVVLVIMIIVVIALLFGGFQKGTKSGSLGRSLTPATNCAIAPGPLR
jgi:hypothetical protein